MWDTIKQWLFGSRSAGQTVRKHPDKQIAMFLQEPIVSHEGTSTFEPPLSDEVVASTYSMSGLEAALISFWDRGTPPIAPKGDEAGITPEIEADDLEVDFLMDEDFAWTFSMSEAFLNSIKGVDKKLQGRILEAIGKICESPLEVAGDTIKPLTGDRQGMWRCRIGDYRLVYQPNPDRKVVVLLTFSPRGSAYCA